MDNNSCMRKLMTGILIAGLVAVTAAASPSQQAPNFSGVWGAVNDAPATLPKAPSAIFGTRFEFRQTSPERMVVVRQVRDSSVATEHPLDGTEVRIRMPGAQCMGDSGIIAGVTRNGSSLTYRWTGILPAGGGPATTASVTYIFRLTGPDTLEVEGTTRIGNDPTPRQVGYVYKRTTEPMPPQALPKATPAPATIADASWIAGNWSGTTATTTTEERWTPPAGGAMLAVSRTLRGTSMTAFEFLCIAERHGGLVYTAMPNARTPATDFTMTSFDATSATFENPSHDFPKKIRYAKTADGMEATISGEAGQRATTFSFKKQ